MKIRITENRLSRRRFLTGTAAIGAAGFVGIAAPRISRAAARPLITHGIQSGDVGADQQRAGGLDRHLDEDRRARIGFGARSLHGIHRRFDLQRVLAGLDQNGIDVSPFHLSKWAIPTAVAALVVHSARLLRMDTTRWGR